MSGPVRPPLTVEESDGSVVVRPANTIKFNEADFTVAKSGNEATISIDSTGTGAALTATHVGFGNSSNLLTGSSKFTYDDTAGSELVTITGSGTSDLLKLESTDAGTATAPDLVFYRSSSSPAGNDYLGRIDFRGKDSAGNEQNYGIIAGRILTAAGASEDGAIYFKAAQNGDTNLAQSGLAIKNTQVVVNDGSASYIDFLVNGDNDPLISTSAGQDNVGIGGTPDSGVERLEVIGAGSSNPMVQLRSTESGASASPHFSLYRNNTGSNNDDAGLIEFQWDNADGTKITGAQIYAEIQTATAGSESNRLRFYNEMAGSFKEWMRVSNGVVEINAFSDNIDFKIEGDTGGQINFYSDASQDNIGIGTTPTSGYSGAVPRVHILQPDNGIGILLEDNQADADVGPQIVWYRNSASPAADDLLGRLRWEGKDSGGNQHMYGRQTAEIVSPTDGAEKGRMVWESRSGGALFETMRFEGNDIIFNNDSSNAVDLQIKGDNDTIFFSDASQDNCGIGTSAPDSGVERLHVKGTGTGTLVRLESTDADATHAPTLELYRNSATPADNDLIGKIEFSANDAGGTKHVLGSIRTILRDEAAGGEDGTVLFEAAQFGSDAVEFMRYGLDPGQSNRQVIINNSNTSYISFLVKGSSAGIISTDPSGNNFNVNPFGSSAVDMIVQGDTDTRLIRTDASQDNIGVSCDPSASGAKLQVDEDLSYLLSVGAYTANHDVTAEQAHGYALQMKTGSGTGTFTLPETAVVGMHLTVINFGAGMNVAVSGSSSHKINGGGSAGNSTTATVTAAGARYDCVYIATDVWNVTAPAVVSAS